jgi:hypothetical protein
MFKGRRKPPARRGKWTGEWAKESVLVSDGGNGWGKKRTRSERGLPCLAESSVKRKLGFSFLYNKSSG